MVIGTAAPSEVAPTLCVRIPSTASGSRFDSPDDLRAYGRPAHDCVPSESIQALIAGSGAALARVSCTAMRRSVRSSESCAPSHDVWVSPRNPRPRNHRRFRHPGQPGLLPLRVEAERERVRVE